MSNSLLRILAFAAFVGVAMSSCPNDCNQHGLCNQYSACECYRNWMGTDCSQRVCPFGHSFVDTPQGDLNADGKVDRPDIYYLKVDTGYAISNTDVDMMFPANVMIFSADEVVSASSPSLLNSIATSVESTKAVVGTVNWEFHIPVTIHDRNMEASVDAMGTGTDGALGCSNVAFLEDDVVTACSGSVSGSDSGNVASMNTITWSENVYTYPTQFTNAPTWELYPLNHAKGKASNELARNFAEAHFYSECSGKGTCDRETGQCNCYSGYEGVGCTRTSCPNDCSGHGVCHRIKDKVSAYGLWDRKKTQLCTCDSGYTGIDCSQRNCPSGDDPITRPTSASGDADNSAYFHLLPHSDGDEPEIQTFGYVGVLTSGNFALEFTDEFGDKWVTKTMDFLGASAHEVEVALEELPNHVIQDVHVSYKFLDDVAYIGDTTIDDVDYSTCTANDATGDIIGDGDSCYGHPRMFQVTFVSNSGDVPSLGVRYSVVDDLTSTTETDNDGAFTLLVACSDSDLSGEDTTVGSTELVTCVFNDDTIVHPGSAAYDEVSTANAIEAIGFEGVIEADYVASGNDYDVLNGQSHSTYYNGLGNVVVLNTGRTGSQENSMCSNRGLCDYGTGLCSCFNGFTDDDCSVQNALAMY